jgi:hypothetical protein
VKSAQIINGIINGVADQWESPNVLQVISSDNLSKLLRIERIRKEPYQNVFLSELVIACTKVTESELDELHRTGTVNHTVVHRFESVIERDGYFYSFPREQFERDARADKLHFKMPPFPEIKKPLDLPPPPEWEMER